MNGKRFSSFVNTTGHHPDGPPNARDETALEAMVAIRTEFPDAKIIVLTTYE